MRWRFVRFFGGWGEDVTDWSETLIQVNVHTDRTRVYISGYSQIPKAYP